jgi:hypothetical protein
MTFIDPLIEQARLVHFAARLEYRLKQRRELRDDPHKRGWMTRKGPA